MIERVERYGINRDFSTDHYPEGFNAFQVARLHKPVPIGYPLQRDSKGRIMKKGEGIAPVETTPKPKRKHISNAQMLALEAKEKARHETAV